MRIKSKEKKSRRFGHLMSRSDRHIIEGALNAVDGLYLRANRERVRFLCKDNQESKSMINKDLGYRPHASK